MKLREELCKLDPFDFEKHVMSFFQAAGYPSMVTKQTNDFGIDGWAEHPDGFILVQCKRYAHEKKVGRPEIQKFKGAIEEELERKGHIYRGYFVTTSTYSEEAIESAKMNPKLFLVDMDGLIEWHRVEKVIL